MSAKVALGLLIALGAVRSAAAHELDEYVQATLISLEADRVDLSMRLVPGAEVFDQVMKALDTDGNGVVSAEEARRYAERVVGELTLSIDGSRLAPRVVSVSVPTAELLREGMEATRIELTAQPPLGGTSHRLVLENRHLSRISAYLVNCLVPRDSRLRVVAQHRSRDQASYQLDYVHDPRPPTAAVTRAK